MGCCGDREKGRVSEEQKWDYMTLSDFKATSCLAPFSYVWLWILVIVSIAVYIADAYTAITLLAFNKWTSQVKPKVDFEIAKWIFAICIIISYVFLIYRWIMAMRVIRSGGVAESYLDPLAAVFQSLRIGKNGQGFRRFLVFAELTKSKKGVDYIALFVYFQFQGAFMVILAQGPRIVINALTLWAVMDAKLIPKGENAAKDRSKFAQFFVNIELMAEKGNKQETIIYFTMLFSLFIWVIAALSLLISILFYVFFLWHYIPSSDGRLSKYCRRKIDARLERIVGKKVKKALEKQDQKRRREEQQAIKNGEMPTGAKRAPTLPKLGGQDDAASIFSHSESVSTLPLYSSQPPSRSGTVSTTGAGSVNSRAPTLPSLPSLAERPMPSRTGTQGSTFSVASYESNAPLLEDANRMGTSSPPPSVPAPPMDRNGDYFSQPPGRRLPPRLNTNNSGWSDGQGGSPSPLVSPLPNDLRGPPRTNTGYSSASSRYHPTSPLGNPTFFPYDSRAPSHGDSYEMSPVEQVIDEYTRPELPSALRAGGAPPAPQSQSQYPAPPGRSYTTSPPPSQYQNTPSRNYNTSPPPSQYQNTPNRNYNTSPPPARSGTAPPVSSNNPRAGIPAALQSAIQRREASNPLPNRGPPGQFQQRSATAPIGQGWMQPGGGMRSASAAPGGQQQQQQRRGPAPPRYDGYGGY